MDTNDLKQAARDAGDSEVLEWAARAGYAVNGVMHLLIAWIAIQLAFGGHGKRADQSGALQTLASTGLGTVLLWVAVIGFAGLAVWQLAEAIAGAREVSDRVKAVSKAVVYAALAVTAVTFALGGRSSSEKSTNDVTAGLMGKPFGVVLVAIVALVILGVAVYHVYKGWTKKFLQDLRSQPSESVVALARFGYIAKGVALGVVGVLFGLAAVQHDPKQAGGLDSALRTLLRAPFGQGLLVAVALGLAAYGLYSFARARHAKV
jgi:hypothetical protein